MATKKIGTGEATVVMTFTVTSIVKADVDKLEKAAEAEAKRITKAIDRLKLDNVTTSQSKTFIKDE